jgi:hypothetical protein
VVAALALTHTAKEAVSAQPPEKVKLAEMEVWPILSESRVRKMASVRNLLS